MLKRLNLWLALLALPLPAQQPGVTPSAPVTLRAQTSLVVLDVVVTDKSGNPVSGLKREDFLLAESGTPQLVRSFDEHGPAANPPAAPAMPPLPPGTFTNFPATPAGPAVTVLLFDKLNTAQIDQSYVRDQMLKYLKTAKTGERVAIFGLDSHLYMIQGFTSDPDFLRRAVANAASKNSPLLDDPTGLRQQTDSLSSQIAAVGQANLGALQDFESDNASFALSLRARYTLNAMTALGRYLAGVPGRKNLIWFSSSFPLYVLPSTTVSVATTDSFTREATFQKDVHDATNLLARSRVAVYPIEARGVVTSSANSASLGHSMTGSNYENPGAGVEEGLSFAAQRAEEQDTMLSLARDTGGHAFLNTNAIADAVGRATSNGSNFYTLSYSPAEKKTDGEYRSIDVKLAEAARKRGYQLSYRRGYYADQGRTDAESAASPRQMLSSAGTAVPTRDVSSLAGTMAHGLPPSTQILYKASVQPEKAEPQPLADKTNLTGLPGFAPAKPPFRNYRVDFAAPARQVDVQATPDGKHRANVEFITVVFGNDGKIVNLVMSTVKADLDDEHLAQFRAGVLTMHQTISVPVSGDYFLRFGIRDTQANKVGDLELPVASLQSLPPAAPVASPETRAPSQPSLP